MTNEKNKPEIEIIPIDPKVYEVINQVKEINEKILAQNSEILKQNSIILQTLAMPKFWLNNNITFTK